MLLLAPSRSRVWSTRLVRRDGRAVVLLLAALSVAARLPSTARPLSPDEGGFLMVAAQWAHGTSLYGDYWVDRPPLLIALFQLAQVLGGGPGLRLLGDLCVATSVVLAAVLARAVAALGGDRDADRDGFHDRDAVRTAGVAGAVVAAALLVSPLSGAAEVDGELLSAPFVLGGLAAAVTAYRAERAAWWWVAGALAVAAASVKQDMLDVVVAAVVLLLATARRGPRVAGGAAAAFGLGALCSGGLVLGWAFLHGTTPAGLWDAVVTFRVEASAVIAREGPTTSHRRVLGVAGAFVASGGLALLLAAAWPRRTPGAPRPSRLVVALVSAVVAWEAVSVVAGGSYWLHYLVGCVPGLVLATAAAALHGPGRRTALRVVVGYAAVVSAGAVLAAAVHPVSPPASELDVERYLASRSRPGDTGVVGFGDPALLRAAHLSSPYPELWSLPVRVRDPRLAQLTTVLTGPDRPTWVVVAGAGLGTWGVDAAQAQPVLDREYRDVHTDGDLHVYRLRGTHGVPSPGLHPGLPSVAP